MLGLNSAHNLKAQTTCTSTGNGQWASAFNCTGSGTPVVYDVIPGDTIQLVTNHISLVDSVFISGILNFDNGRKIDMQNTGLVVIAPGGRVQGGNGGSGFRFSGSTTVVGPFNDSGASYAQAGHTAFVFGNPLPVSWNGIKLEAQGTALNVEWSTASELNNSMFEIQVATDPKAFESIGFVGSKAPNGTSKEILNYEYTFSLDERLQHYNTLYVRIKQIDFNGRSDYSPIAVHRMPEEAFNIQISNRKLSLQFKQRISGQISILTPMGQLYYSAQLDSERMEIDVDKSGPYVLLIDLDRGRRISKRILIK